ncbi:two-component system sensor histidine kinase YesM [Neobacillus niacini]|uniref:sensor histidine kinase n=1 Tax=Neobacillus niacini TaxID=86668 RepID=UPI0028676680|nr:histidine kinase [Neobacillus niacini]MDR7079403.1 two-component system sensor histidine kinase YesM [Neobacillus niacini]
MKSTHQLFLKHFFSLLIPAFIPLCILGTLSFFIIYQYIGQNEKQTNHNVHKQILSKMDILFDDLGTLNIQMISSAIEINKLQHLLNVPFPDPTSLKELSTFKNFIDSPPITRSYIESIYIYVSNHQNRFISSTTGGLMEFEEFYDTSWYDSYNIHHLNNSPAVWLERRSYKKYGIDNFNTNILSFFQTVDIMGKGDGVIVLNIYADYLQEQLNQSNTIKGQKNLIVDKNGKVIISGPSFSENDQNIIGVQISDIIKNVDKYFGGSYLGYTISKSEEAHFSFYSFTPHSSLYALPIKLGIYIFIASLISLLVTILLSLYLTKKNTKSIYDIIRLLNDAEFGNHLQPRIGKGDLFTHIIEKILVNFLEKKYLKTQLNEKKVKSAFMELSALQAQLNPHFLLNTLETIKWKAVAKTGKIDNPISEMIEHLGDILKSALDYDRKYIPFIDEIKHAKSYIAIQKIRYKDKFDVIWDVQTNHLDSQILKLLLQPIIENSLEHGLRTIKNKMGLIKIKVREKPNQLIISVSDNGTGFETDRVRELREKLLETTFQSEHIGLINTGKRLRLSYGEDNCIQIYSKSHWGTMVKMTLPIVLRQ